MTKNKLKVLASLVMVLLILIGGLVIYSKSQIPPQSTTQSPQAETITTKPTPKPAEPKLTFTATGDLLAHDTVNQQAKTSDGYNYKPYFSQVKDLMKADVVFCNPETPSAGPSFGISGYPSFNAPTEFAKDAVEAGGCNLINLATNHIGDKGLAAAQATLDVWDSLPILAHAGTNRNETEQQTVRYFTKNDIKVAFLAFADFSNVRSFGAPYLNLTSNRSLIEKLVTEARQNADAVIVAMHWGTEDSTAVNWSQTSNAQLLNQLGADVIIGTGPHVLQKVEWLTSSTGHKTLVWYSLGNLLSSQLHNNQLTGGVASFTITKKDGVLTVSDPAFTATFMSYDWPANQRGNLLARHNLELLPLAKAQTQVAKMGGDYNERVNFVHQTLGDQVKITP